MTDKSQWLTTFDPDNPGASLNVEAHPADLSVTSDELIQTDNLGANTNLTRYSGIAGLEQIDIVKNGDGVVISTNTFGSAGVGKVNNSLGVTYSYSGTGVHTSEVVTPASDTPVVEIPASFTETSNTSVLTTEGVRYSVLNTFNSNYAIGKVLNGTASSVTDGTLWTTSTSLEDTYILVEFSTMTQVDGFKFQNMRSDYAITAGLIEIDNGIGGWTTIFQFTLDAGIQSLYEFRFLYSQVTQKLRFRATSRVGSGAVGRLEFFSKSSVASGQLNYKPLVIDSTKYDVVETASSFELSLKDQGASQSFGTLSYLSTNYAKLESRQLSNVSFGHATINFSRAHPFTDIKDNFLQLRNIGGAALLPAGTYRYRLHCHLGASLNVMYYLADVRNGSLLHSTHSANNSLTAGSSTAVFDGTITLVEDTPIMLVSVPTSTARALFTPTTVSKDISLSIVELWKLSTDVKSVFRKDLPKPTEVVEALPIILMDASLAAGDGRGVDDGDTANTWNAINSIYWSSASHYITIRVDHDFRFWRYPNASYVGYNNLLKVQKVDFGLVDYSSLLIPLTNEGMVWQRFSETLPPGTYRVGYGSGLRMDTEWCLEKMPLGTGGFIEKGVNVIISMTAATGSGQTVTASSQYNSTYAAWKAFDGLSGPTSNSGWASSVKPTAVAPQWVAIQLSQVETVTGYLIRNRAYGSYTQSPKSWELQGSNNGTDWTTLHSVADSTNNITNFDRFFELPSPETYLHFRLFITDANGTEGNYVVVEEFELYYKAP